MSIVFSALTPHPPLLIPAIGKENLALLKSTINAFKELEESLYATQPDTILIISPHGQIESDFFCMNLNPLFTADFEQFGDFSTRFSFTGNIGLAHKIRERLETSAPIKLISVGELDHGSSVPLYLLASHLPKVKILPLYYSGLNLDAHFRLGQLIKKDLLIDNERIAIIASGDLSHRLTKNAPAGYSPKGKKFDQKLIELILKNQTQDILKLNQKTIDDAGECGLKSIVMLEGILDGIKHDPKLLSYEGPFGVGYAVINFIL